MMGIQQFCKEHKMWGAEDANCIFYAYVGRPRPSSDFWSSPDGGFIRVGNAGDEFPLLKWNEFLINPDGDIELLEPMEKAGESVVAPKKEPVQEYCIRNRCWVAKDANGNKFAYTDKPYIPQSKKYWIGHLGRLLEEYSLDFSIFNSVDWENSLIGPDGILVALGKEKKEVPAPKIKWIPKRGDPIFVWDGHTEDTIPCCVKYFYCFGGSLYPITTFNGDLKGEKGASFSHCRKFDPSLVGIPRKDWPPSEDQY
jgi:hypothetical protein